MLFREFRMEGAVQLQWKYRGSTAKVSCDNPVGKDAMQRRPYGPILRRYTGNGTPLAWPTTPDFHIREILFKRSIPSQPEIVMPTDSSMGKRQSIAWGYFISDYIGNNNF